MLGAVIEAMHPDVPGARWVPAENLHVTVSFLGWVDDVQAEQVAHAMTDAVSGLQPIATCLAGLGAFPRASRARVLWAGLDDRAGELATLAGRVHQGLAQIGFEPEAREWRAHVTLARLRAPRAIDLDRPIEPLAFTIEEVALFQSMLQRPAPLYRPVAIAALG